MKYDLAELFLHPLRFRRFIPSAIVVFGGANDTGQREIAVEWKACATDTPHDATLTLSWDVATLRPRCAEIDEEPQILRTRDDDRATWVEEAAVIVAIAVLANLEPETRFTRRSATWTRHDYYLNEAPDEMIEIAGRWEGGLPGLFDEKRAQSDQNLALRRRWVSVTVARENPRNRTEGLHT